MAMRILVSGVRSFVGTTALQLRPLTLLVGENSAGKSTLLGMTDAVLNGRFLVRRPTFNVPPYELGSFDDIASYSGGSAGRAKKFSVGFDREDRRERLVATYEGDEGQPTLAKVECQYLDSNLTVTFSANSLRVHGSIGPEIVARESGRGNALTADQALPLDLKVDLSDASVPTNTVRDWRFSFYRSLIDSQKPTERQHLLFSVVRRLPLFSFGDGDPNARSIAPVRTRPRRVYDAAQDQPDPEGDYIPFVLARTLSKGGSEAEALRRALERFGAESGLFTGIKSRRLSRRTLWPFQIEVENSGPSKNLIDVGYGVSQALPIVVESVLPGPPTLLVQQPEVHLHPRAQAALGTFFAELASQQRRRFVVETHSDYLIDRVRMAVAAKILSPDDVLIAFVHRPRASSKVHELNVDTSGNVLGAPRSYREFFLREQLRLFQQ
jgi:hypothetical protein